MDGIVTQAEASGRTHLQKPPPGELSITVTTCHAGCYAAADVQAKAIAVFTREGGTAFQTSRFRPKIPIVAFTQTDEMARRLALAWGVRPFKLGAKRGLHALLRSLDRHMLDKQLVRRGDIVVVLMKDELGEVLERTNLMRLHRVGSSLS